MEPTPPEERETGGAAWPVDAPQRSSRGSAHYVCLLIVILATLGVIGLGLFAEADPRGYGTHEQLGLAPCRMLQFTGVPCPACGVTTSVTLAAKGEVVASFVTQPFGLLCALAAPLATLWALLLHFRGKDIYERFMNRRAPWVRVGFLLAFAAWVYRLFA